MIWQLCETCIDHAGCHRVEKGRPLIKCDVYKKDRNKRFTADELTEIARKVAVPARVEQTIKLNTLALTEEYFFWFGYPRKLLRDFLFTDLTDPGQLEKLISRREISPHYSSTPEKDFGRDLAAVQRDILEMAVRYAESPEKFGTEEILPDLNDRQDAVAKVYRAHHTGLVPFTDIRRLNIWLGNLTFSLLHGERGEIRPFIMYDLSEQWFTIFYFLFAEIIVEKQPLKLCPAKRPGCTRVFLPGTRGRKSKTCQNEACRKWAGRQIKKHLKK